MPGDQRVKGGLPTGASGTADRAGAATASSRARIRTRILPRGPAALLALVAVSACHEDPLTWGARAEPAPAPAVSAPREGPPRAVCADVDAAVLVELARAEVPALRRYAARIEEVSVTLQDVWRGQGHSSDDSRVRAEQGCHRLLVAVLEDAETQRRLDEVTALAHAAATSQPSDDDRNELIRLQHLGVASNARVESLLAEADRWSFDSVEPEQRGP